MDDPKVLVLGNVAPAITAALERMLGRPRSARPFVIVAVLCEKCGAADCVHSRFVQFCGSSDEPLKIDCPRLGLFARYVALDAAAAEACLLFRSLGVHEDAALIIGDEVGPTTACDPKTLN